MGNRYLLCIRVARQSLREGVGGYSKGASCKIASSAARSFGRFGRPQARRRASDGKLEILSPPTLAPANPQFPLTSTSSKPQKVGFVSLGCPKNLVDSEVMMGLLARAGAEITHDAGEADVIVVNTCSFIESAK